MALASTGARLLVVLAVLCCARAAPAAQFALGVSPPRYELQAAPGQTLREVLLLLNTADEFGDYEVRTADWHMDERGGVAILPPTLTAGSCRPWVAIERRKVKLPPRGKRNYRFEIAVPDSATTGECRFALVFSQPPPEADPEDRALPSSNAIRMPIGAQMAVIVYVAIGDAKPRLRYLGAQLDGKRADGMPLLRLANDGQAHGRAYGDFLAIDSAGNRHELIATPAPILPGSEALVPLMHDPSLPEALRLPLKPPLQLHGSIESAGEPIQIDVKLP